MIAFLQGEPGADVVEDVLTAPECVCSIHGINLCEVYYHFWRQDTQATAEDALNEVAQMNITIREDMDVAFVREIGRLKVSHTLSLGDCCGLALAIRLRAKFVTADRHEFDAVAATGNYSVLFIR